MLKGIDISNHNYHYLQSRDWYDILAADFVIMKASEGVIYKDVCLDQYYNILHGSSDGKPDDEKLYGFYHYCRPEKYNSPIAEAKHFLSLVRHHAGHCIYALDVEGDALRMSKEYLGAWVTIWLQTVKEDTGVTPLIYCSESTTDRFEYPLEQTNCGLWVAKWAKNKPSKKNIKPWDFYAIWQNGTTNGHLDTDVFNGSVDTFRAYCHG